MAKKSHSLETILLIVFFSVPGVASLKCYHCITLNNEDDCISKPTKTIDCPGYCHTKGFRNEGSEVYKSFMRNCETTGNELADWKCHLDGSLHKCSRYCDEDLCNGHDRTYVPPTLGPDSTAKPLQCFACNAAGDSDPAHCKEVNIRTGTVPCTLAKEPMCITRTRYKFSKDGPVFDDIRRACGSGKDCDCVESSTEITCDDWCDGYLCNNDHLAEPWKLKCKNDNKNPVGGSGKPGISRHLIIYSVFFFCLFYLDK